MYIPWDPPLVLLTANLLMVSIMGLQFKTMAQRRHLPLHSSSLNMESNPGDFCSEIL